ncbi:hypothetical protein SAMN04487943_11420 [Gracilibacillus orientalis]|uniref:Phospholipid phosphatase n=1 Tax=Gracilibacillus orientalis TaxID=334253 RepID=A0A1I4Q1G1_9BACI|nr:hypothetical protein [Gracilibacillus orientalis]SFM33918.1 hypothetical protein SAMN04487943_11420 [Gracilibacillus orientalis]
MDFYFYLVFTLSYLILLIVGFVKRREKNIMSFTVFLYLVIVGLTVDNAIIAFGKWIGTGSLLESLHLFRYWIHALITPTLLLFCLGLLQKSGKKYFSTARAVWITLMCTCVLILIEIITVVAVIELKPVMEYGILHYVPVKEHVGSILMIIMVSLILLVTGFLLYIFTSWKWMLVGTIIMGIGSALPIKVDSTAFTNALELVLMISLVATDITFSNKKQ